ncbi:S-adenosyl-L-homocysteine hydrolase [Methanosarcina sp. 2.H.T.1A.6]|uniref:adenosylhomocysteinase n=1 Tax=unclassified Methanosarcina TaxID=2644672 RepID=UPI0006225597|nr:MULTISPECIES: adenosylhomocysteinase [unclassified Methanosarcina]KKG15107.1 S-adenosyl-L-homocysteine hydrolase [Methanosarcina sp. 2.H.T.1A.3]KKG20807.1 S-adenosyl-L-homocysteine hydrolase [Methanosarcina sp. 2.H.T.1A.8]KKG22124.1 S-adenosyl-L-homocysteine hydrolase [Methanosarcina sp. 2.H.T.1A.6]KKH47821.1 S-adenosyl-L-homocysteine hydrolase [Methanosarcina sp. 1.H.A.2.2]KKH96736.1 S-adenosyl-L-homocysteine hydrolase [Methanosarcina sp. 1.H.T.1A.1]
MTEKELVESGNMKMEWARSHMPVLAIIREKFEEEKPLKGLKVGMALHVEAKTAVLVETLAAGGAQVAISGCNPLSTQDDVSMALDTRKNISCFAKYGCNTSEYYEAIDKVLDFEPDITIDDGADLIFKLHKERTGMLPNILGGCEETTTGVHRLHAMEKDGALKMPVIAVNDAMTKYLFDNRYGTGQSAWDGINRTTNLLVAGKNVVVAGYGWCGRGVAMRATGLGANVIVTEIDPIRALEARMDGHRVMRMADAAKIGEIFVTATGNRDILTAEHFKVMQDGAILANSGHFNVEIDMEALASLAKTVRTVRHNIKEYDIGNRRINVIAEGRLVNLAAGDGHPAEVMDMSFANQALCVRYIAENNLLNGVHGVPKELDTYVATLKLESMGISTDKLTSKQECYMNGWECGT